MVAMKKKPSIPEAGSEEAKLLERYLFDIDYLWEHIIPMLKTYFENGVAGVTAMCKENIAALETCGFFYLGACNRRLLIMHRRALQKKGADDKENTDPEEAPRDPAVEEPRCARRISFPLLLSAL